MIRLALVAVALLAAACGGGGGDESTAAFHVAWQFELPDGTPTDCAGAGVDVIIVVADEGPGIQSITSQFECALGAADTRPLPLGSYMIKLEQYNQLGRFILSSPNTSGELVEADAVVDVAPFVFVFDPSPDPA